MLKALTVANLNVFICFPPRINAGTIFGLPNRHNDLSMLIKVPTSSPEKFEVRTSFIPE
jgi:hypothetical protein